MKKLLIILLADKNGHENAGRAIHALLYARQAEKEGIETKLIFDGGGTEWAIEMAKKSSHYYKIYKELLQKGVIEGVCQSCSKAFDVEDKLKSLNIKFLGAAQGHPNIGKYFA